MANKFYLADALTLPMVGIIALDELRIAATHRFLGATGRPQTDVFLGPVRTEAYWATRATVPRRAYASFPMGTLTRLFDAPIDYAELERFELHLSAAIWMLARDLRISDGSSFVDLPLGGLAAPAYTVRDNDVAVVMNLDRKHGYFRLTAAVVN